MRRRSGWRTPHYAGTPLHNPFAFDGRQQARLGQHRAGVECNYMQTAEFQHALETLIQMSREKRTAIMCAEAVPWRCHRSLVADALSSHGVPVVEILSETNHRMHKLTHFARVEGTLLTYPSDQETTL